VNFQLLTYLLKLTLSPTCCVVPYIGESLYLEKRCSTLSNRTVSLALISRNRTIKILTCLLTYLLTSFLCQRAARARPCATYVVMLLLNIRSC